MRSLYCESGGVFIVGGILSGYQEYRTRNAQ